MVAGRNWLQRGIWYWTKNLLVNALVASSHGTATTSETVKSVLQPENGDRLVTFKVKVYLLKCFGCSSKTQLLP